MTEFCNFLSSFYFCFFSETMLSHYSVNEPRLVWTSLTLMFGAWYMVENHFVECDTLWNITTGRKLHFVEKESGCVCVCVCGGGGGAVKYDISSIFLFISPFLAFPKARVDRGTTRSIRVTPTLVKCRFCRLLQTWDSNVEHQASKNT